MIPVLITFAVCLAAGGYYAYIYLKRDGAGADIMKLSILCGSVLLLGIGGYFLNSLKYEMVQSEIMTSLVVLAFSVPVACIDKKTGKIPNRLVIYGVIAGFMLLLVRCVAFVPQEKILSTLADAGLGILLAGGVFFLCGVLSRGGIGAGDIKVFAVLGLMLGFNRVFTVIMATVLVAAIKGIYLLITKKADKKSTMPMGPFILIGVILAIAIGM